MARAGKEAAMARKMISKGEWACIKRGYRYLTEEEFESLPAEFHTDGGWRHVWCEGCDPRYGTIMVSESMHAWRHPTLEEFYGGAVVD